MSKPITFADIPIGSWFWFTYDVTEYFAFKDFDSTVVGSSINGAWDHPFTNWQVENAVITEYLPPGVPPVESSGFKKGDRVRLKTNIAPNTNIQITPATLGTVGTVTAVGTVILGVDFGEPYGFQGVYPSFVELVTDIIYAKTPHTITNEPACTCPTPLLGGDHNDCAWGEWKRGSSR